MCPWKSFIMSNFHGVSARNPCQYSLKLRIGKPEENLPTLEADIHHLVQEQSQVDPTFRSTLSYARISARAVRKALLQEKGYRDHELPSRQTIGSILNRLGYRLKKHKK